MYFVKIPAIVRSCYKQLIWDMPGTEKAIYLTFDDGPDPHVTPDVLSLLIRYKAMATFFCLGRNAEKHRSVLNDIRNGGHCIGNHTFDHLNGWNTQAEDYFNNAEKANERLQTDFFRPPYGKITRKQIALLKPKYKIIMWSVMPGDFDQRIPQEEIAKRAIKSTRNGSIVVFHDNIKCRKNMLYALEHLLSHFSERGFSFKNLERVNTL